MTPKLKGKWALVTGATSGMGLEYSRQLAARGCNILMVSNQQQELSSLPRQLQAQYGVEVEGYYADLCEEQSADAMLAWCREHQVAVEVLVCNAGMFYFDELTPGREADALRMLRLHVLSTTRLCLLFGEEMKVAKSGNIIVVSSLAAGLPMPGITVYAATKAYLKSFGKSLYYEMRPYRVGVTTVMPAAIATGLYGLKPSLMKAAIAFRVIRKPEWLVRRAIRGMLRRRRVVRPGAMNYYLPFLISLLPKWLVTKIWTRLIEGKDEK